jgi:hypothetical protein
VHQFGLMIELISSICSIAVSFRSCGSLILLERSNNLALLNIIESKR